MAKQNSLFYPNDKKADKNYRNLTPKEIEILVKNNNSAEDWNDIYVAEQFDVELITNCEFYGKNRIGALSNIYLEFHDLKLPVGLDNSTIISCDIGDNVVIREVHYLANYVVGDFSILFNIDEMSNSNHSKFGNGFLKKGENEDVRIWIELANENAGRKILPFEDMITADAFIWSKFRGDKALMKSLFSMVDGSDDKKRGYYGEVGKFSVIKNSRIIKDTNIGEYCYIKGANKIKNTTIRSSKDEPTQIGEGVELVNGIIGYSNKIFYGAKGVRFVMGTNCQLKYGARLLNSVMGDNSTVSCCEILNNLIFPFHEQHHNSSFLIASTLLGQSNIASGATIGSNHNSRAPDGEIIAGRGFWPGLCTSFKHNSKFASYSLIVKGDYLHELNIEYPFSLISLKKRKEAISIVPAYWFFHNMYALARNQYKFKARDKRKNIVQHIEIDPYAPDTISEVLYAMDRIAYLIGKKNDDSLTDDKKTLKAGIEYINDVSKTNYNDIDVDILDSHAMRRHGGYIKEPIKAYNMYKDIVIYFAVKNIINYFFKDNQLELKTFFDKIATFSKEKVFTKWWNLGGQIVSDDDLENLKSDIKKGNLKTWKSVHTRYDELDSRYEKDKTRYGLYALEKIYNKKIESFSIDDWREVTSRTVNFANFILESSIKSRKKDYTDPFRKMMYDNEDEMVAVLGDFKENSFLKELDSDTKSFINKIPNFLSTK